MISVGDFFATRTTVDAAAAQGKWTADDCAPASAASGGRDPKRHTPSGLTQFHLGSLARPLLLVASERAIGSARLEATCASRRADSVRSGSGRGRRRLESSAIMSLKQPAPAAAPTTARSEPENEEMRARPRSSSASNCSQFNSIQLAGRYLDLARFRS